MRIGEKLKKLRELKGLSQENMADELKMSVTGYGKIERNEVDVNFEKLARISEILGVKVEDVITFDEKIVFNNYNNEVEKQIGNYYMPMELKQLYEDQIQVLKDKIKLLERLLEQTTKS